MNLKFTKIQKYSLPILFSIPIILNFLFNTITNPQRQYFNDLNFYDLIGLTFYLTLFISIGKFVKSIFPETNISLGIIYYLFSYYFVELILILLNFQLSLKIIFLIVNFAWVVFALIQKKFKQTIVFLLTYLVSLIINYVFVNNYSKNQNLIGDVESVFFPQSRAIFENGYFYSLSNQAMDGYPQFLSYLQSLIFQLGFSLNSIYFYVSITSYLILFLFFIFIYESNFNRFIKILIYLFTVSLIFNSDWLNFLFINSLMGEGILSFLTLVLISKISNKKFMQFKGNYFYLVFGSLALTKHFIIEISLLLIIVIYFLSKNKKVFLSFIPFLLEELIYRNKFKNNLIDHHISQIDISQTFLDLLFFNNLKLENILYIFKQLFIDKPVTYLLIAFFIAFIYSMFSSFENESSLIVLSIVLNFIFIIILYISVWKNMELESPIRYILNFLYSYIYVVFLTLNNCFEVKKMKSF